MEHNILKYQTQLKYCCCVLKSCIYGKNNVTVTVIAEKKLPKLRQ